MTDVALRLGSCSPIRRAVWKRDEGRCRNCGIPVRPDKRDRYDNGRDLGEIDHVLALRDGGLSVPDNLQLLCLGCNRRKAGEAAIARRFKQ